MGAAFTRARHRIPPIKPNNGRPFAWRRCRRSVFPPNIHEKRPRSAPFASPRLAENAPSRPLNSVANHLTYSPPPPLPHLLGNGRRERGEMAKQGRAAGSCHTPSEAVEMSQRNNVANVVRAHSNYGLIQNNVIRRRRIARRRFIGRSILLAANIRGAIPDSDRKKGKLELGS